MKCNCTECELVSLRGLLDEANATVKNLDRLNTNQVDTINGLRKDKADAMTNVRQLEKRLAEAQAGNRYGCEELKDAQNTIKSQAARIVAGEQLKHQMARECQDAMADVRQLEGRVSGFLHAQRGEAKLAKEDSDTINSLKKGLAEVATHHEEEVAGLKKELFTANSTIRAYQGTTKHLNTRIAEQTRCGHSEQAAAYAQLAKENKVLQGTIKAAVEELQHALKY